MKIKFKFLAFSIACITGLAACVSSVPSTPWHIGEFRGEFVTNEVAVHWFVECHPDDACRLGFSEKSPQANVAETYPPQKSTRPPHKAIRYSTTIPNNNLAWTKHFASSRTAPPPTAHDAIKLGLIKKLVQSDTTFHQCMDISNASEGYFLLCSSTSDKMAKEEAYLLACTMNPTCSEFAPFCAYYFFPVRRVKSATN